MSDKVRLRDLPGIADFEIQCEHHSLDRLMKDEREAFPHLWDEISIRLTGITEQQTYFHQLPDAVRPATWEEWEKHFEFHEYQFDEEDAFWDAIGVDMTDGKGEHLTCREYLERQIYCAVRGLHPDARLTFLTGEKSDAQIQAEAEAWAQRLLATANPTVAKT